MFSRFLAVGGACFALNLGVLWLGTHLLGWHYLLAALASLILVNGVGFWLNRGWTFRAQTKRTQAEAPPFWSSLRRYYVMSAGAFALNLLLMALLVELLRVPPLVASAVVGAVLTVGNFVTHRAWSFATTAKRSEAAKVEQAKAPAPPVV